VLPVPEHRLPHISPFMSWNWEGVPNQIPGTRFSLYQ
jgi:hypothetical protein